MIELKRVLVAIDFSEFSEHALRYGAELAAKFDGELFLLHVIPVPLVAVDDGAGSFMTRTFDEYEEDLRASADNKLKALDVSPLSKDKVFTDTRVGAAFVEIVQFAKAKNIDLIVMGTHGRTGLKHMILGSVAERVVRKAACPVLTIQHPEHGFVMPESA
ncbi:MAG: universal stress protein [Planctomycetaceae bacterium]